MSSRLSYLTTTEEHVGQDQAPVVVSCHAVHTR